MLSASHIQSYKVKKRGGGIVTRPDTYILKLRDVKGNLKNQIAHCKLALQSMQLAVNDPNYAESATQLEKDNMVFLINLVTQGLEYLEAIVWE